MLLVQGIDTNHIAELPSIYAGCGVRCRYATSFFFELRFGPCFEALGQLSIGLPSIE